MPGVKPLIAIHAELDVQSAPTLSLPLRYVTAVEEAGARPVIVPPVQDRATLRELCAGFDALLFSGGDDFDTARLGLGPTHPAAKPVPPAKQDFDLALVRAALAEGLPMLGICYGMQLLGLCGGGSLHQHLPEDRPGGAEHRGNVRHAVRFRAGSKLRALVGVDEGVVVSRHHQALSEVGSGWSVSAVDGEGLIEGIELDAHPFALGVQWHPELSEEPWDRRLFQGLVAAARAHAEERALAR